MKALSHDEDLLSDDDALALRALISRGIDQTQKRPMQEFYTYFPDTGPFRRSLYAKHMEFFAAGAEFPERLFCAANRVGKSTAGSFECTCHLTGRYPDWWEGRRFTEPIEMWACGTTSETTRDIVQAKLLGPHDNPGTGMIPSHLIIDTTRRPHGLSGSIESAYIRHVSGGKSLLGLKTYEQGRKSFEGTAKHVIWDDEQPPLDVYTEQLYRTLTTHGIMLVTFTPLQGMIDVVKSYFEPETDEAKDIKLVVQAGWDDVPHLDEKVKRQILATTPPYQIAARTKGEPSLGSGAIYPIPLSDITIPANVYPDSWRKGYGMDVGWRRTAALFVAEQPTTGNYIAYDEHYMAAGEPPSHALGIRSRGEWLIGAIDPAAGQRSQHDGVRLIESYKALGLNLVNADHAVETGLMDCWTLLITGRFKVGANCVNFLREFRQYHRDEQGHIVAADDHLMAAFRYWTRTGRDNMTAKPRTKADRREPELRQHGKTWMSN